MNEGASITNLIKYGVILLVSLLILLVTPYVTPTYTTVTLSMVITTISIANLWAFIRLYKYYKNTQSGTPLNMLDLHTRSTVGTYIYFSRVTFLWVSVFAIFSVQDYPIVYWVLLIGIVMFEVLRLLTFVLMLYYKYELAEMTQVGP